MAEKSACSTNIHSSVYSSSFGSLKTLGCTTLDDLAQFDSQLQLSLAAWGYYYEDYIKLSTGVRVLQASKSSRDQDYEIQLVHSLAERRLNEKWSIGMYLIVRIDLFLFKQFVKKKGQKQRSKYPSSACL